MFDALDLIKQLDPEWVKPVGRPIALAFRCINAKEVDEVCGRIAAAGFRGKSPPFDAFWGQRYATVLDPDGNAVDLFADQNIKPKHQTKTSDRDIDAKGRTDGSEA
jgi:uncharacterized glyoxalase superfamily protein PhnB